MRVENTSTIFSTRHLALMWHLVTLALFNLNLMSADGAVLPVDDPMVRA